MKIDGSKKTSFFFFLFFAIFFPWQDLEQMAMEQDKESDKQAMISQVEGHRKQMLR